MMLESYFMSYADDYYMLVLHMLVYMGSSIEFSILYLKFVVTLVG